MEFVFFLLLISFAIGEIIISPQNTEASVGETTILQCTTTYGTCEWHHYPIDANSNELVYKGGDIYNGYKVRFNVAKDNGGACNLIISNVTLDDAGSYTCLEMSMSGNQQKAAELIVFGVYPSNSSCSAKYICPPECDNWEMSCSMSYRGNIQPTMEWKTIEGDAIHSKSSTTDSGITTSAIRVQYDVENSYSYICQIKYSLNSLDSKYKWSFQRQVRSYTSKENHGWTEPQQQPETIPLTAIYVAVPVSIAFGIFLTLLVVCIVWKRNVCRKRTKNLRINSGGQSRTRDDKEQAHLESDGDEGESDEQEQDQFANKDYEGSIITEQTGSMPYNMDSRFSSVPCISTATTEVELRDPLRIYLQNSTSAKKNSMWDTSIRRGNGKMFEY